MTLIIWFKGHVDPIIIEHVASVNLISTDVLETRTFGNDSVLQRNVSGFTVSYSVTPSHGTNKVGEIQVR